MSEFGRYSCKLDIPELQSFCDWGWKEISDTMVKVKNTNKMSVQNLALSAMFVAIGIVLPFFTGQVKQIGNLLLPMHIPVILCGLICGWQCGIVIGFILPLLRSVLFGMPMLYPIAMAMAVELAVYGFVSGFIYNRVKRQNTGMVYVSMICAMICGRIAWGLAEVVLLGLQNNVFTWQMFLAGAFINAVPGIILQLILIPAILATLNKTGLQSYKGKEHER